MMKNILLYIFFTLNIVFTKGDIVSSDFYSINFKNILGEEKSFKEFSGKKILIVNVASYCGYTRQYKDLQKLQDSYGDQLQVIAFPCNDFGSQEPGNNSQIAQFCESNYSIKFPVMSKINIRKKPIHPVYKWLTNSDLNGWNDSKPKWNFYKYLIDEDGNLIKSFGSNTSPLSSEIIQSL
jgi:glutathione peroxidase